MPPEWAAPCSGIGWTASSPAGSCVAGSLAGLRAGEVVCVPALQEAAVLSDFQRAELAKWGKAVRDSGASMD